ncbi:MAG TPA: hypothetical protein VHZ24_06865 [Pirellulales bacterium]|jgi:hypothetical protein|nr:hypothetical protein [Pirellulales bacterium]
MVLTLVARPFVIVALFGVGAGIRVLYLELSTGRPAELSLLFFASGAISAIVAVLVVAAARGTLRS